MWFSFKNMSFKLFLLSVMLVAALWSVSYFEVTSVRNNVTVVKGFFPFSYDYNNQGEMSFSEHQITIEAMPSIHPSLNYTNSSQPEVLVYSLSGNFNWSLSAKPVSAVGKCNSVRIAVQWKTVDNINSQIQTENEFLLWSDSAPSWIYNQRKNNKWGLPTPFPDENDSALTMMSSYEITIGFKATSEKKVVMTLAISNSTWDSHLREVLRKEIPAGTHLEDSNLYVGAWARDQNASSSVIYSSSQVASGGNSEPIPYDFLLLSLSIVASVIPTVAVAAKHATIASSIKSFFRSVGSFFSVPAKEHLSKLFSHIKNNQTAILVLGLFAGLRLVVASATILTKGYHIFDIHANIVWLNIIQDKGLAAIYPYAGALVPYYGIKPGYPYPPIIAYLLSLFPKMPTQEFFVTFSIMLPGIIADLLLCVVVFVVLKKSEGLSVAFSALLLSLLNFANSSIWGQTDSIVALLMVLAVWMVATRKVELGWAFAALAVLTKQTALVFLPALVLISVREKPRSRLFWGIVAFTAVFLIVWLPLVQSGFSFDFALRASGLGLWSSGGGLDPSAPQGGGGTSIWAFNIWPLITYNYPNIQKGFDPIRWGLIGGVKDTYSSSFFPLSYFQLGIILFVFAYLFLGIRLLKATKPSEVMLIFGLLFFAFFMLPTRIHERYLVFALAFLPFAVSRSRLIVGSYLVLLITYWLNLEYALLTGIPGQRVTGLASIVFVGSAGSITVVSVICLNILIFLLLIVYTLVMPSLKHYQFRKPGGS